MALLAPITVFVSWIIDLTIWNHWGRIPDDQLPRMVILALAIFDLVEKISAGTACSGILCGLYHIGRRDWKWGLAVGLTPCMLLFEGLMRGWGAAWGDLMGAIAHALGMPPLLWSLLPFVTLAVTSVLYALWRFGRAWW